MSGVSTNASSDPISIDGIVDEHEEIEDLLEGLLIFPDQKGLRNASKRIQVLFEHEKSFMETSGFSNSAHDSHAKTKTAILQIIDREMNGSMQVKEEFCKSN